MSIKKFCFILLSFLIIVGSSMSVSNVNAKRAKKTKKSTSSMVVTVTKKKTKIKIKNLGKSGTAKLYAYHANEYYTKDKIRGISKKVKSKGTYIGKYKCGSTKTFTLSRYSKKGVDTLYNKYYLIKGKKIVKGPVYATKITPRKKKVTFKQKTVKGVFNDNPNALQAKEDVSIPKDLGASSITVNFDISYFRLSNTKEDTADQSSKSISFKSNGKTYYVNAQYVAHCDSLVKPATRNGMNVVAIVAPWYCREKEQSYPDALKYPDWKTQTAILGTNTSNDEGRDYYIAFMEFLANRYSKSKKNGYVSTYVIGNEVDFCSAFYRTKSLNKYMEEYSRTLRLANLAIKKYAGDANVAIPFTHYWAGDQKKIGKEGGKYSFKPYKMLNWLAKYTNNRGAYDWAIAPHCYCSINSFTNVAATDSSKKLISGNYKTSKELTFSNLEILQLYLSQKTLKYNNKIRSVYLTESGVSSSANTKSDCNIQCMSLIQAYYRIANLSCIKSFNYYRVDDHKDEAVHYLSTGLRTVKKKKKPSYYVYKYIDTKKSNTYTKKYLKYVSFWRNGKTEVSYTNKKIKSWKDAMTVYTSKYNWKKKFNAKAILRKK